MFKISLKALRFCVFLVALAVSLLVARMQLTQKSAELDNIRTQMRYLDISDPKQIAAVQLPGLVSVKQWSWRVYLPADREFQIRVAYENLLMLHVPQETKSSFKYKLDSGESFVSVALNKTNDTWAYSLLLNRKLDRAPNKVKKLA